MSDFALFFIDDFGRFSKQNKKELNKLDFIFILYCYFVYCSPTNQNLKTRGGAKRRL